MKSSGGVLSFYAATHLKPLGKVRGGVRKMWEENITTFTDYKHPIWSFLKVMDKQAGKNMGGNHK